MSNENQETPAEGVKAPSEIETFSKSIDSRFSSTDEKINALLSSQQLLLDTLSANQKKPEQEVSNKEIADKIYTEPEEAISMIERRVESRLEKKINTSTALQEQSKQVLADLVNDFPELTDTNSDLYKTAINLYAALPEAARNSPTAYETAVYKAATKIGLHSKAKRTETSRNNDDFQLPSTSKGVSGGKSKDVSKDILQMAQRMGQNINDSKYLERLKSHIK